MKLHLVVGLGCALAALSGVASAGGTVEKFDHPYGNYPNYGERCVAYVCQPQPQSCAVKTPGEAPKMGVVSVAALVAVAALRATRRRAR
jgi:MYXO-CTERM domain-containing protein